MTRKEAIDKVYGMSGTKEQHEALDFLVPEIRELREFYDRQQENERIRKIITDSVFYRYGAGVEYKDVLDYLDKLEKQKEQKPLKVGESAYFDPNTEMWFIKEEQKPVEFTHHETNESLKDAVTHQMEDDGDVDDFVRRGIDDIALKYAELGAKWQKEQKPEEKPINWTELTWEDINYLEDLMAKVHYEFRNGIGAESFGKEVLEKFREYKEDEYTDEKEQKPAEWDELQAEFRSINEAFEDGKKEVVDNPERYGLCKSAEWSEEDETYLQDALWCIEKAEEVAKDENDTGNCWCARRWLKSLPLKPKKENEEWRHYIWATNLRFDFTALIKYDNTDNYEIVQAGNRPKQEKNGVYILIKDIKPQSHWKPSEHQMNILKAVKDYVGKGSGYWGEGLGSLIDDLEKLM